jgi:hypothetical protein
MYEDPEHAADLMYRAAELLIEKADLLLYNEENARAEAEFESDAEWLRGARRELAELIRDVEGPNPPQAPRRHA